MIVGLFMLKLYHNVTDRQTDKQTTIPLLCLVELTSSKDYYRNSVIKTLSSVVCDLSNSL